MHYTCIVRQQTNMELLQIQSSNKLLSDQQMNPNYSNCFKHNKPYQFLGSDNRCQLNCRICSDCLRGIDNPHKKGVSNHETISIEQLASHFQHLQKHCQESISECNEAVQKYFRVFETMLKDQIEKEKERISKVIRKILLAGITKEDKKLEIILSLYNQDFSDITCSQIAQISEPLFNFRPKNNNLGFSKFINHINSKQANIFNDFKEIVNSKSWERTFLKKIENDISFPDFDQPLRVSRVKTEEDTPKKTLRRSIRRQYKKSDLKDISVHLKKPIQLPGSTLIDNKEENIFLCKLFQHRNVNTSTLLYRASQNDFSVKEFHRLCDGQSNTLVLVRTEFNKIIGGFTSVPWKSTANTLHSDVRRESFLFSLSLKQKMNLIDDKSAIFNSANFGPTFGAGADLAICHNGNVQKTSYSQFPYSYGNSRYRQNNQHSTALFTGQKNGNHFLLKEWQVWKIIFQ